MGTGRVRNGNGNGTDWEQKRLGTKTGTVRYVNGKELNRNGNETVRHANGNGNSQERERSGIGTETVRNG